MEDKKKDGFWRRVMHKYRLAMVDESNLNELWHIHLNGFGAFSIFFLLFLLTIALLSVLIIYTPIRNILPGYSESIRRQLIVESARVDSLSADLALQRQYLSVIQQVTAGTVQSDTVQSLDSLQIVMREQLLEAKNEATAEFVAQYEAKEKDNLQLFDAQTSQPTVSFFRPMHGVVERHVMPEAHRYGVLVRAVENENITAVMAGTVVYVTHELDETFTVMLQHENYVSVYRHVGTVLKTVGVRVQAGESIALLGKQPLLEFELWKNGHWVNPEEVIVF